MTGQEQILINALQQHIPPNSHLLVHASSKRLLQSTSCDPETLLVALRYSVGKHGTLLLPTFNWGWLRGESFDIQNTPSEMGVLSETARLSRSKSLHFIRSGHPVYSFTITGAVKNRYAVDNASAYGPTSPFQVLADNDGWVATIDIGWESSMTALHWIEEIEQVYYKYYKRFTALYTTGSLSEQRSYFMYVRSLHEGAVTEVAHVEQQMLDAGLARQVSVKGIPITLVKINDLREFVSKKLNDEHYYLHSVDLSLAAAQNGRQITGN